MDHALKALCLEVLSDDIDSEKFALLLIETGICIDSFEWEVANRLLEQQDVVSSLTKIYGHTVQ